MQASIMKCSVASTVLLLLSVVCFVHGTYVLTTPKRWVAEFPSQTCASLTDGTTFAEGDSWTVTVTELSKLQKILIQNATHTPTSGDKSSCFDLVLPETSNHRVKLDLEGSLAGKTFSESVEVEVRDVAPKVFIQTDKAFYKPGQTVNFRILRLAGPFLDVSTENYSSIYIVSPDGTRIAQWLNVDNSGGLVHIAFELHNEVSDGRYSIRVQSEGRYFSRSQSQSFEVKDYVLPRYELTITPPSYILGSDKNVTLELCAKYTFGQPVKGVANMSVAVGTWRIFANVSQEKEINGCTNFTYDTTSLRFDDNNCHIRVSALKVTAVVTESGTDSQIFGQNFAVRVHRQAVSFRETSASRTLKRHMPSVTGVSVRRPDQTPAVAEKIQVCTQFKLDRVCKNLTTDAQGQLEVLVPSDHNANLQFHAVNYPELEKNFNFVMEKSRFNKYRYDNKRFSDAHNSSITIFTSDKLECATGQPITFNLPLIYVVKDQPKGHIQIQGLSRGQVQFTHNQEVDFVATELPFNTQNYLIPLEETPASIVRGVVNIAVTVPNTVSPHMKIVAWFKNPANAVVVDNIELDITPCLSSSVQLSWSKSQGEPGTPVDLLVKTEPDSLCSIGVVDKSVELLSGNTRLTAEKILQNVRQYESNRWGRNQQNLEYCIKKYEHTETVKKLKIPLDDLTELPLYQTLNIYPDYTDEIEALHAFNDAGFYVFSDLDLEKEFCDGMFIKALKALYADKRPPGSDSLADSSSGESHNKVFSVQGGAAPPLAQAGPTTVASFELVSDKEGTIVEEQPKDRVYFPETWLWQLSVVPSTGELTESHTLPDTITEWIGSAVCVNRASGVGISGASSVVTFTPFFTDLTLPSSVKRGEILPVTISVFNYQDSSLPVSVKLLSSTDHEFVVENGSTETGQRDICIPANDKLVITIKIQAKIIGDMNLTVEAATNSQDTTCSPSAPLKSDRLIRSIPVEAEGFRREKTWTKYLCAQDYQAGESIPSWDVVVPENIVVGSEVAWVTAMGDLLGPTIQNLGNLIAFPSGCGEQNMLNLAPNIFILQYLEASKQGSPQVLQKLKSYMASGYQRQLMFRHSNDGSYSTFGKHDISGSTWLTAFVMKSFAHAQRYIFVDEKIQSKSFDYLTKQQQTDGCFRSQGRVVNKMMQGGVGNGGDSLLTAYVLSAFIEAQLNPPGSDVVSKALPCILKSTSTHPYDMALRTYSLALANEATVKSSVDKLIAAAASNSSSMRWEIPDKHKNSALAVETASYALMAMLICDQTAYAQDARKVVRWLTSQRNGLGGFISTQDTVVALQALAYFERIQPAGPLDLAITTKGSGFEQSFLVDESNKFLEQRFELPQASSQVDLTMQGTGCALAQAVLRYNVLTSAPSDAFTVSSVVTTDAKCKFSTISVCTSYKLQDGASNMAILEVGLVSGYVPVKEDLQKVVTKSFKRYEVDGPKIVFYLEEITAVEVCAVFRVYQQIDIGNVKPATIRVYDYYQPELMNEMTYTITAPADCSASKTP